MNTVRSIVGAVAIAASLSLTACGAHSYAPLTQANFAKSISDASAKVKSVHMTMKASSRLTIGADFNYNKPVAMQMSMSVKVGSTSSKVMLKLIGETVYFQAPPVTPTGKWAKVPASTLGAGAAKSYQDLGPQGMAAQFKKGIKSVSYVGTAKIDGQTVEHYTLVADSAQLGASLRGLASQVPSLATVTTVTEQIYLSQRNELRRVTITLPAPIGTMQMDFSQLNTPVSITAPPAADVVSGS